jgi:hypothetical protein
MVADDLTPLQRHARARRDRARASGSLSTIPVRAPGYPHRGAVHTAPRGGAGAAGGCLACLCCSRCSWFWVGGPSGLTARRRLLDPPCLRASSPFPPASPLLPASPFLPASLFRLAVRFLQALRLRLAVRFRLTLRFRLALFPRSCGRWTRRMSSGGSIRRRSLGSPGTGASTSPRRPGPSFGPPEQGRWPTRAPSPVAAS